MRRFALGLVLVGVGACGSPPTPVTPTPDPVTHSEPQIPSSGYAPGPNQPGVYYDPSRPSSSKANNTARFGSPQTEIDRIPPVGTEPSTDR